MLRRKVFIVFLCVGVLFAVYRNYTFFRQRARTMTRQVMAATLFAGKEDDRTVVKEEEDRPSGLSTAARVRFLGGGGRNPFVPVGGEQALTAEVTEHGNALPRLKAVLWSGERRIALLDGEIYREGEEVYGRKILRIEPEGVILAGGGDGILIALKGGATP